MCDVCSLGGTLMCCDGCPASYLGKSVGVGARRMQDENVRPCPPPRPAPLRTPFPRAFPALARLALYALPCRPTGQVVLRRVLRRRPGAPRAPARTPGAGRVRYHSSRANAPAGSRSARTASCRAPPPPCSGRPCPRCAAPAPPRPRAPAPPRPRAPAPPRPRAPAPPRPPAPAPPRPAAPLPRAEAGRGGRRRRLGARRSGWRCESRPGAPSRALPPPHGHVTAVKQKQTAQTEFGLI
jgi:hypothetical protein